MLKSLLKLDRWFLDNIFQRNRIFYIQLGNCVDEFGNTYGSNGNHFFIKALRRTENKEDLKIYLEKYYELNKVKSVNDYLGKSIGSKEGNCYFLPWEKGRIRSLDVFVNSHKAGPTSLEALERIVDRLLKNLKLLRMFGFSPVIFNSYPRVIKIICQNKEVFLIRDGQHRMACLSYLKFEKIPVCYEEDYWKPSKLLGFCCKLFKNTKLEYGQPRVFKISDADNWPHVQSGIISKEDAIALFMRRYY